LVIIVICIFSYFVCIIYKIEIHFLNSLINFNSKNFDEYFKDLEELKKKFRDINEEDDKLLEDIQDENDIDDKIDNNSKTKNDKINYKKEYTIEKNVENKKKERNKIQQQKIKKKIIISNYFYKSCILYGLKVCIILIFSTIYFAITIAINSQMKKRYKQLDSIIEQINSVYYNSFKIYIIFKEQFEILLNTGDKTKLNIPKDSEIIRPKFGNSLIYITNLKRYSKESLKIFNNLYNNNACQGNNKYSIRYILL
jgi:predicted PurR-regulated permease PerM